MDISNDNKVKRWLLQKADKTKIMYLDYLGRYCELAGKTPTELIDESYAEIRAGKFPSERKDAEYMTDFIVKLQEENYAPKSMQSVIAIIKSFYKKKSN